MKKTIAIFKDNNGCLFCLDQITRHATSRGCVVNKFTIIFNSKKEAYEAFKALTSGLRQGVKLITLNDKQARLINEIKTAEKSKYINLYDFLEIK